MRRKGFRSLFASITAVADARSELSAARATMHPMRPFIVGASSILALWLVTINGCSLLQSNNRSVIKVESKRNTARANRLTYAGIRAMAHERFELAAEKFRDAIEADFSYGPAHNNLGLLHYEQGNLYQAVLAFEQAREFLPTDPAVVNNLALALEAAGQTQEAMELYYTANAMDRANPHYLGNLVRLRVRLGEYDDVLQQQLRDLAMIETRPDWRRWADHQLALNLNDALDRGPATPDFESTANETRERKQTDLRDKIIDLTPVIPASLEQELPQSKPGSSSQGTDVLEDVRLPTGQETLSEGSFSQGSFTRSTTPLPDQPAKPATDVDDSNRDLEELLKENANDLSEDDYYRQ